MKIVQTAKEQKQETSKPLSKKDAYDKMHEELHKETPQAPQAPQLELELPPELAESPLVKQALQQAQEYERRLQVLEKTLEVWTPVMEKLGNLLKQVPDNLKLPAGVETKGSNPNPQQGAASIFGIPKELVEIGKEIFGLKQTDPMQEMFMNWMSAMTASMSQQLNHRAKMDQAIENMLIKKGFLEEELSH